MRSACPAPLSWLPNTSLHRAAARTLATIFALTAFTGCATVEFERAPYFHAGAEARPAAAVARLDFDADVFVAEIDGVPLRGRVSKNTYPAWYVFAPGRYQLAIQHVTRTAPEQTITFEARAGHRYRLKVEGQAGASQAVIIDSATNRPVGRAHPIGR